MKRLRQLWDRLRRRVANYYEAARFSFGERSLLLGGIQDARLDADAMTRREILRKARYFEKNNAFVNRLADIFEQYTVGATGLQAVSASPDANAYFARPGPRVAEGIELLAHLFHPDLVDWPHASRPWAEIS